MQTTTPLLSLRFFIAFILFCAFALIPLTSFAAITGSYDNDGAGASQADADAGGGSGPDSNIGSGGSQTNDKTSDGTKNEGTVNGGLGEGTGAVGGGSDDNDDNDNGGSNDNGSQKPSLSAAQAAQIALKRAVEQSARVAQEIAANTMAALKKTGETVSNVLGNMGYSIGDDSYTKLDDLTPKVDPVVPNPTGSDQGNTQNDLSQNEQINKGATKTNVNKNVLTENDVELEVIAYNGESIIARAKGGETLFVDSEKVTRIEVVGNVDPESGALNSKLTAKTTTFDPNFGAGGLSHDSSKTSVSVAKVSQTVGLVAKSDTEQVAQAVKIEMTKSDGTILPSTTGDDIQSFKERNTYSYTPRTVDTSSIDGITDASGFDDPGITNPGGGSTNLDQRIVDSVNKEKQLEATSNDQSLPSYVREAAQDTLKETQTETQKLRQEIETERQSEIVTTLPTAERTGAFAQLTERLGWFSQGRDDDTATPEDLSRYTTYTAVNEDGETIDYKTATPGAVIDTAQKNVAAAEAELTAAKAVGGDERAIRDAEEALSKAKTSLNSLTAQIWDGKGISSDAYESTHEEVATAVANSKAAIDAATADVKLPAQPTRLYTTDELREMTAGMSKSEMSAFFTDLILQGYASIESRALVDIIDPETGEVVETVQKEPWGIATADSDVPILYVGLSPRDIQRIADATGLEIMTEEEANLVNDNPDATSLTPNPQENVQTTADEQFYNMLANSRAIAAEKAAKCDGACEGVLVALGKDTTIGNNGVQIQGWDGIQDPTTVHFVSSNIGDNTYWDYSHVTRMKSTEASGRLSDEELASLVADKKTELNPYRAYTEPQTVGSPRATVEDLVATLSREESSSWSKLAKWAKDTFTTRTSSPKVSYTDEELDLMTRITLAETSNIRNADGTINMLGVQAVAEIMRNRMLSESFPDTLAGVLTENWQFTAYKKGEHLASEYSPNGKDYASTHALLEAVLNGEVESVAVDSEGKGMLNYGNVDYINGPRSEASRATRVAFNSMASDDDSFTIFGANSERIQHTFGTLPGNADMPVIQTIVEEVGGIFGWVAQKSGIVNIAEEALPLLEEQSKVKTVDEAIEVNATRKAELEAEEKDMPRMMHVYSPETIKERYDDIDKTREVVEVTDSMVNNLNSAIGRAEVERDEMERIWLEDVLSGRDTLRPEVVEAVDSAYRAVSLLETMRDEAIIAAANEDVINTVATQGDANKYSDAVNTLMNAVSDTSISVANIAVAHGGDALGGFANMTNGTIFSTPGDGRPGRLHDGYDYGTGRGDPWVAAPVAGTITSCSGDGGGLAGGTCYLVPDDPSEDCDGARTCVIQIMHVEGIVTPNTHVEAGEIIANTGGDRSTLWGLVTILAERQAGRELTPEERDLAAWEIYDQNGGVLTNELKSQFAAEGLSNAYSGNPAGEQITPPHPHVQVKVDDRLLKGASASDRARLERIFGVEKGSLSSINQVVPFPTLDALVRNAEVAPDEQAAIVARDARKVLSSDNSTLEIIETNAKNAISLMNEAHNVYNNEYVGQIEQTPERDQKVAKLTSEAKALADRNQDLLRQAESESRLATINPSGSRSGSGGSSGSSSGGSSSGGSNGTGGSNETPSKKPKNDVTTIVGGSDTLVEIPDYNLPYGYDDYIVEDLLGGYGGEEYVIGSQGDDLLGLDDYSLLDSSYGDLGIISDALNNGGSLGSQSPLFFYNITPSESSGTIGTGGTSGTIGSDGTYTIIAPGLTDRGESYSELGDTLALYGTEGISTEQPRDSIFSRLFSNNSEFTPEDVRKVTYTYKPGDTQYSGVLEYVVTLADGTTQTFKISETSLLNDAEIRIENAGCRGEACIALLSRAEYQGAIGVPAEYARQGDSPTYNRSTWWQRFTETMSDLNPLKKEEESTDTYTNFGDV